VLLALSSRILLSQAKQDPSSSIQSYENAELGFRYRPPNEMRDKTKPSAAMLDDQAKHLHTKNKFKLLLSMSSGPDDSAADWHSVTIVENPRDEYSQLDDASAEEKMSDWVGGASESHPASQSDPAAGRTVVISGQTFLVSLYVVEADGVKKASAVWTTIRREKLLSFAFAANSPGQLKILAETVKTVQFY
jgi:hypothetical protein